MLAERKLNESGYVTTWLVSGVKEETYETKHFNPNQLEFEKEMRQIIADDNLKAVPSDIKLGAKGLDDFSWEYYQVGNNWFIDFSLFYFTLARVELYASTILCVPQDKKVKARLWTYAAVDLWVNGKKHASVKEPVYKPIKYIDVELDLHKGENDVFIRMQNLGVRDTRSIFGLQIREDGEDISVKTHDYENVYPIIKAEEELMQIVARNNKLCLTNEPSVPIDVNGRVWEKGTEFFVNEKEITVSVIVNGRAVSRTLENPVVREEIYTNAATLEEHQKKYLAYMRKENSEYMQEIQKAQQGSGFKHALENSVSTEKRLKITMDNVYRDSIDESDYDNVENALTVVFNCSDCADFKLLDILIILLKARDKFPEECQKKIKEAILNFRYWMDENGSDGMCFWSENHAVGFYACQLMAGLLYPDEIFVRSGRTGKEQNKIGNSRCREWLDSIEETGFEEFFSPGYMGVTFEVILTLIDYAEEDVSERAWKIADKLLGGMFMQTFDGCIAAPHGRIYGNVITPVESQFQGIYSYFNRDIPLIMSEIVSSYNLSKYEAPEFLAELMTTPVNKKYQTGNAEVNICKTDNFILTSVSSERSNSYKGGWSGDKWRKENPYETGNFSFMYVKALNEKFHGTTLFQPGVYGYQQHMWTAALSKDCLAFVNHPGATNHTSKMRPGYWYANGLFPALSQWDNTLLSIYRLDEKHPINFTHLYFPKHTFDCVKKEGNWIFGLKNSGMIAIWCNLPLVEHNDVLSECEYRAYGKEQGYVCICSDIQAEGSFEVFCSKCLVKKIKFDTETLILNDGDGHEIQFIEKYNDSQVI